LFVNLIASLQGNAEIAIGNVLGSNVANILLILGVASLIFPLAVSRGTVWREIPFALLAAVMLGILANDRFIDGAGMSAITRTDGVVFLCFFVIFLYYSFGVAGGIQGMDQLLPVRRLGPVKSVGFILLGLVGLGVGGHWIVNGAVHLALALGMSQNLAGLTIVAVGTSLPELATSATAAYRRNVEIAVGNVVGSNIFNVFFVLGISSVVKPLPFQWRSNIDVAVVVIASLLLFLYMFTGRRRSLDRWEGGIFVFLYAVYLTIIIILG
jgi:cation:H+ antiporter